MEAKLLERAREIFRHEGRLIRLPAEKTIVFVGDTHGDSEASEYVISRFLRPDHVIVFLGDYVDRGPDS
ncbi:TPA: serine/threonine protein phosphatase, partial [Candidatus Micrarchaeota archaeon]|nr:serine/threonine protein phosphatase [Candidatus Micrarchaeota archaeon]